MNDQRKELTRAEAEKLANNATQTKFTWAVIFLAFIAGLVGLLPMVKPHELNSCPWGFSIVLFIVYSILTLGLSYSFYALWRTSAIIEELTNRYESTAVKGFLAKNWAVFYLRVFLTKEHKFARRTVTLFAVIWGILWILLFFFKCLL